MTEERDAARRALEHWPLTEATLAPLRVGLINQTFRVDARQGFFVLQRLNPIFQAEVHRDIDAVTAHLAARGLATPRLVRTAADALWLQDEAGDVWRLQTGLPGRTVERLTEPSLAAEAGALLGRFHRALHDCDHTFCFTRQAHGLPRHVATLRRAVEEHRGHRLYGAVRPLAEDLLARAADLPSLEDLPQRITHGDPKISNVLFHRDRALAWVDLDTLGRLDLPTELGDAFRSWCNPAGEDGEDPRFDVHLFQAALTAYAGATGSLLTAAERERIVAGVLFVCVELACRFLADALNESYFGWDPTRHPGRGEHNLHRARGQARLARDLSARAPEAQQVARRAFAS